MENTPATVGAIVVGNPLSVTDSVTSAIFAPPYLAPHEDYVLIGGFSVPAKHAELYTKIWEKYRHIATTKKITSRFALVKRLEEILSSIRDMCKMTGHTVSRYEISNWEFHRDLCVDFEFNASWFCEGFSEIQKLQAGAVDGPSADLINQQVAEVEKLSQELNLKQEALQSMMDIFSKKNEPLLSNFP